ncbi:MAG: bifunctional folylpolyglutamate synthase/dihydrofolate synthase [Flavobacterium sp.]
MNYQETISWMFEKLPMYQKMGASAYKADLNNTLKMMDYLNHPDKEVKCIHIAGTNGKGSTSSLMASVFQECGYTTGLYTSPHLKSYRERIKINGVEIEESFVVDFFEKHINFFEEHQLSFFEMTVGLAFDYFRAKKIDIAVIEVGMGGRLDATNVITPLLSVITNIGLDHTQFLGDTLAAIASEKAGIIKEGITVIIGEYHSETINVFKETSKNVKATFIPAFEYEGEVFESDLKGDYQIHNRRTALVALKTLNSISDFKIVDEKIKTGFLKVKENTGLMGRWQQIHSNPTIICDTAHNGHGLEYVTKRLKEEKHNTLHIVLGVLNDKNLDEILPLFPKHAMYYFAKPNIPRGLDAIQLSIKALEFNLKGTSYNSISQAYEEAIKRAQPEDFIFVGGSTFTVAEIL